MIVSNDKNRGFNDKYVEVNELETILLATNLILDNLASTVVLGSLPLQPEENHDKD